MPWLTFIHPGSSYVGGVLGPMVLFGFGMGLNFLTPPPAEARGFLAQEAPQVSDPQGLTPSTPAGTEPARLCTAKLRWLVLGSRNAPSRWLGSRSAPRTRYPTVFRPEGETPFPALLRRGPIPPRPEGRGILGGTW